MNTTHQLTAEAIAAASHERQDIEDMFEEQTPPEIFRAARSRADMWPRYNNPQAASQGLQYAYLLEFLITDEIRKRETLRAGGPG